jgi:hypothetical protein
VTGLVGPPHRVQADHRSRALALVLVLAGSAATIPGILLPWVRDSMGVTYSLFEGYPEASRIEVLGEVLSVLGMPIVATATALLLARGSRLAAPALVAIAALAAIGTIGNVFAFAGSLFFVPQEGFWLVIAGRALIAVAGIPALRVIGSGRAGVEPRPDLGG